MPFIRKSQLASQSSTQKDTKPLIADTLPVRSGEPKTEPQKADYEIGYKKPPKQTQFKPGQSGNPKGRPKGAKSLHTMALAQLKERVAIKTPSGTKRVSKIEALLMKQMEKASSGDAKALQILFSLYDAAVTAEQVKATEKGAASAGSPSDQVIIQLMRKQFAAETDQGSDQ